MVGVGCGRVHGRARAVQLNGQSTAIQRPEQRAAPEMLPWGSAVWACGVWAVKCQVYEYHSWRARCAS